MRDDDIIIATAYKSGTTWMQNIVLKLTYQGRPFPLNAADLCPWLDLRAPPIEVQAPLLGNHDFHRG
jgi:aryl sulfotransferase